MPVTLLALSLALIPQSSAAIQPQAVIVSGLGRDLPIRPAALGLGSGGLQPAGSGPSVEGTDRHRTSGGVSIVARAAGVLLLAFLAVPISFFKVQGNAP